MDRLDCLYIHIGPHKTGSSAIQSICDMNRAALADHGVLYPSGRWHGQLGSYFARDKVKYVYNRHSGRTDPKAINVSDDQYIDDFVKQIKQSNLLKTVISYEGFIDLKEEEIANLRQFMEKYFSRFEIIGYCRHPLSFAPSEISQRARMGVPVSRDDPDNIPIPKYRDYFEKFVNIFSRTFVHVNEFSTQSLYQGDARFDFLRQIGCGRSEERRVGKEC